MSDFTRDEVCAVAIAETFRGDGEMLVSSIGNLPTIGARLAKLTFEPGLLLTDGVAHLLSNVLPVGGAEGPEPVVEGWMPYRSVFDVLWAGRRHVMMGATQIDRFGNQNIACIGDFERPRAQLLGMRGAPGNTINHPTWRRSMWCAASATIGPLRWARRHRASTRSVASSRIWRCSTSRARITPCAWSPSIPA
jgi:acyl CoA:acetate/3-ketoacid CoA transferase beta subunit